MHSTRQKNCHNCIQSKRKCDRRSPRCARCIEKNATCIYGKPQLRGFLPSPPALSRTSVGASPSYPAPWLDPAFSMGMDFLGDAGFGVNNDLTPYAQPHGSGEHTDLPLEMFDADDTCSTPTTCTREFPKTADPGIPRAGSPVSEDILESYRNMGDACVSLSFKAVLSEKLTNSGRLPSMAPL
jgi:Zn(2)-Cys(6) binuclear cluster domain-containing protein